MSCAAFRIRKFSHLTFKWNTESVARQIALDENILEAGLRSSYPGTVLTREAPCGARSSRLEVIGGHSEPGQSMWIALGSVVVMSWVGLIFAVVRLSRQLQQLQGRRADASEGNLSDFSFQWRRPMEREREIHFRLGSGKRTL